LHFDFLYITSAAIEDLSMDARQNKLAAIERALDALEPHRRSCALCPRRCGANRAGGGKGFCFTGDAAVVYASFLHRGEEPCISGATGSGTIFFSGCSLQCVYCQNYRFSHFIKGKALSDEELSESMLKLQEEGAANINLVTPTHVVLPILRALRIAYGKNLAIPVVYNTSGYELAPVIDLLAGIVDVYLTDIKYSDPFLAQELSGDALYPSFAQGALWKMYEQAHRYEMENGMMKRGVVVRHLVLPGQQENTINFLRWMEDNKLKECFLSLMFQYRPYFKAGDFPAIARTVSRKEYEAITAFFYSYCKSITHGWVQDLNTDDSLAGVHF